ncbi:MAG: peptide chain release factor 1 [Candidatus Brocadiae bacterium]|nr:peptide chain release factor 1 [Candidatus Brocadiia bacterium]
MSAILTRLKASAARYEEIERLITDPAVIANGARYSALMKERGGLSRDHDRAVRLTAFQKQMEDARSLLADPDPEMQAEAQKELDAAKAAMGDLMKQIEDDFLTEDEDSHRNSIVEIRPGPGGEEAALFVADLTKLYTKYAERKGWKVEVLDASEAEMGGYKSISFRIEGRDAYKFLRYESGTHRVQRVPETESQGRIHTSTATVAVLPEAEDVDVEINPNDVEMQFTRSGGPGGQAVNKTSSCVLLFHKPSGIQIRCQVERSQHQNRELAYKMLRARLYDLEVTKRKNARDNLRRSQIGTGDRSEKIRTYNYPQSRITDHRINVSIHNLPLVMSTGTMDELVQALLDADREAKVQALAKAE